MTTNEHAKALEYVIRADDAAAVIRMHDRDGIPRPDKAEKDFYAACFDLFCISIGTVETIRQALEKAASEDVPGVLCYVEGNRAYFTTAPLSEQWGDDWDDAPYEHNAETPYVKDGYVVTCVMFDGPFRSPSDGHRNSPYSVQAINAGAIAWLRPEPWEKQLDHIKAGDTFARFCEVVTKFGGNIYLPMPAAIQRINKG